MHRILIGIDVATEETEYVVSAAAGQEQEALSRGSRDRVYSKRDPILLTYANVSGEDVKKAIRAVTQRIVEKLYILNVLPDTERDNKNILVIMKPMFKKFSFPFPHIIERKDHLITIARAIAKQRKQGNNARELYKR